MSSEVILARSAKSTWYPGIVVVSGLLTSGQGSDPTYSRITRSW